MFGRDKKPASTFTATSSGDPSDPIKSLCEEFERNRRVMCTSADFVPKHNSALDTLEIASAYGADRTSSYIPIHTEMLTEIHAAVCTRLNPAESIAELTDVLDSMECPTDECKSCKYFKPGGVDFCNTSLRIAEYLVLNGIVNVFHVPGLDKTE